MSSLNLRIAAAIAAAFAAAFAAFVMLGTPLSVAIAAAKAGGGPCANPVLPPPQRGLLPSVRIAEPAGWGETN